MILSINLGQFGILELLSFKLVHKPGDTNGERKVQVKSEATSLVETTRTLRAFIYQSP